MTKDKFLKLIKQPSTWRGFIVLITSIGGAIYKDFYQYVLPIGYGIAGIVGMLFDDDIGKAAQQGAEDAIIDVKKNI